MLNSYVKNTLQYDEDKCINCGMCSIVCPHGVFANGEKKAVMEKPEACMECGACQLNCPTNAITVDSGVGCAAAMILAALKGKKLEEASCSCTS
jgi:NAD-dependent dihydropyrimidine dehydrogenase PreA subunit